MTPRFDAERLTGRVRDLVGKAAAPVLAQAITAGTSLLLQGVAVWALGLAEYGAFALFLALLVSVNALYTGFVGDSLAVLNRHDPACRESLVSSALLGWCLCFVMAITMSFLILGDDPLPAVVYAVMVVTRLAEETVRRLLIARLEFRLLVANDACCMVATVLALLVLSGVSGGADLAVLFGSMMVGALAAVVVGLVQLPGVELRALRPGFVGMSGLAAFATWRALQAGLRPITLLAARILVASLLSLAAVGVLEAARLVVAPLQVVINGAGSFLLGTFAAREHGGDSHHRRFTRYAVSSLVGVTVIGGGVLAVVAGHVGELLIGQAVTPILVLGWAAYLTVWAAAMPFVTEIVSRRMSREVFLIRLVDSLVGLGAVVVALWSGAGSAAVPWVLALAGLYSVGRLRGVALRTRDRAETAAARD